VARRTTSLRQDTTVVVRRSTCTRCGEIFSVSGAGTLIRSLGGFWRSQSHAALSSPRADRTRAPTRLPRRWVTDPSRSRSPFTTTEGSSCSYREREGVPGRLVRQERSAAHRSDPFNACLSARGGVPRARSSLADSGPFPNAAAALRRYVGRTMTLMDELLVRTDRALSAHRPDLYAALLTGATDAELNAFEERFSLKLPQEFRLLYQWRNGQSPRSFDSLHDNRIFSTLSEIVETKEILDGMVGYDFDDPRWWRHAWVPFLSNGGGSHLCLDLAAQDGGKPGQLVAFWKADADRPIEYSDLAAWLAEVVTSLEAL
jgi:cell wall assembly regulator SMI1